MLGRTHREAHGDPTTPQRNAGLLAAAEARDDVPTVRAVAPLLREVTQDEVFETELDMLVHAITAAAAGQRSPG